MAAKKKSAKRPAKRQAKKECCGDGCCETVGDIRDMDVQAAGAMPFTPIETMVRDILQPLLPYTPTRRERIATEILNAMVSTLAIGDPIETDRRGMAEEAVRFADTLISVLDTPVADPEVGVKFGADTQEAK